MTLAAGTRLGPYEILASLGAGGMGEVYRARDSKLGREVALKVLPAEVASDADRLARFEREARTVAGLNHPNIVVLHSMEEVDGMRFLTMELVEGQSLDRHLTADGLSIGRVIELGIALADALAAAHEKGVVHRDLKPANVMLTREGRVKVLDFGLARLARTDASSDLSRAATLAAPISELGLVVGTVPYMAPEQIRGEGVDARSDLFSLGILLYELVAGRRPFAGETSADISSAILRDTPAPLTSLRVDLPGDLERIVSRCLAKNPRERFQTALDVSNELRALRRQVTDTDPAEPPPHMPPGRASIAVLPFDNLSGDAEQEYFADGIVEEIITGLSRIKWLFVISRNSTFIYKGKPVDVKAVGRNLGVRYVLQGSVRRSGNHVRVTGQLIDTETAAHVWADRYDGALGDLFTLQDDMTMSVIGAVEPTLRRAEVERVRRKRPNNLDAYDLLLRALPLVTTAMPEDADKALQFLQQAIRLEPTYAAVHGFIAWCHEQRYLRGGLQADTRQAALLHAHAAIETGSDDAMALAMGGFVVGVLERDYETALEAIDRSLALSPSSALAFGFSSIIRALMGEDSTAIEHARMGIRLSPYDPLVYLPYIGLAYAHLFAGNFVEAASAASRASAANPRFSVPRYLHAAALVGLGRLDEAKAMADVLLALQPGFTISGLVSGNITTPERMGMLAEALRRAGLPT
jgi:serine/threonine protein kinase/tetratricopeptide (TPR) repeat protein